MEIKEAIEIIEELKHYEQVVDNHTEAIETVLKEIEHLQKENEELKAKQVMQEFKIDWCEKNTISKDKIKDCLEDIEDYFENVSVPKEDIEFIKEKRKDLLKEE